MLVKVLDFSNHTFYQYSPGVYREQQAIAPIINMSES